VSDYPKRLIEVDLPIKKISAHARREKSIRHGHISTLHMWWARRPLAACRAVLCAALWPDPVDPLCPPRFRVDACRLISEFAGKAVSDKALAQQCSHEAWTKWAALTKAGGLDGRKEPHWNVLRFALLDFIADFANWDTSAVAEYLETARSLTQSAHEALGGEPGTHPLVVDPFAGGGSIPLEALRVGADAFASDLNPVAVLLNKVVLEYIPKYGLQLAGEIRKWGEWIKRQTAAKLAEFYPQDPDGATPVAYLWARTITCEGPGCGAEVPLIRSLLLLSRSGQSVALQMVPRPSQKRVEFRVIARQDKQWVGQDDSQPVTSHPNLEGTIRRGSATCPCCGYTTPVARIREQLRPRRGGANDARISCVVTTSAEGAFRVRAATESDFEFAGRAHKELQRQEGAREGPLSVLPDERISLNEIRRISVPIYGMERWGDLFTSRQGLALATIAELIRHGIGKEAPDGDSGIRVATQTCLAMSLSKCADYWNTIATWMPRGTVGHAFARQAVPMTWDFVEANPLADFHCAWGEAFKWAASVCETESASQSRIGQSSIRSATSQSLPDDSVQAVVTDPPYYDAVPYAHLSDFFYVWLRRSLGEVHADSLSYSLVSKDEEIVVDRPHHLSTSVKDIGFYERELMSAFAESQRILRPDGIGTIVFASKTTASWEAILRAVVDAGWVITGSWPIDTEREARLAAQGQARLASSVHLVCRPRKHTEGSIDADDVGDWRDVLQELPRRIHQWMPRLAGEGVVGADAIFACLGPALEIFSRYSRVEKPDGDAVTLKEYLEYVWAAVSKEAISMIFEGADTTGFEEDARLTAMWLWTLNPGPSNGDTGETGETAEEDAEADEKPSSVTKTSGFALEYDAARKIAQGLGAHLEQLVNLVEVKGETARLLPVAERTQALFGKEGTESPAAKRKKSPQLSIPGLFEELEGEEGGWTLASVAKPGETTLDRLHQAMILFAAGRGEALRRFLVDEGAGKDQRFWRLAQSLCALYPSGTDERRWSEGVLARKKGLGL
jgi:putative DNA methylase